MDAPEARRFVQSVLDDPPTRFARGAALGAVANLEAMEGRFDEARILARGSHQMWEDEGMDATAAADLIQVADIELMAGDYAGAVPVLREAVERLEDSEEPFSLINAAWRLAMAHERLGERPRRLSSSTGRARQTAGSSPAPGRRREAALAARSGATETALRLLDSATAAIAAGPSASFGADTYLYAADAAALAGDETREAEYLRRAADLAGSMGYVLAERRARERLYAAEAR